MFSDANNGMMRAVWWRVISRSMVRLCMLVCAAVMPAATLQRLSMDEMTDKSTAIVRGRILDSYAAYNGPTIYTHYRVQVSERWKGPDSPAVEVMVPGGVAKGSRQSYVGMPRLTEGKEYVLFLWTAKSGITHLIGFTQGVFEVTQSGSDVLATRCASTETILDNKGLPVNDSPVQMRLPDMRSHVAVRVKSVGQ